MEPSTINKAYHTFFSAKGATGVGDAFLAENYLDLQLDLMTDGGGDAALTAKVQGSNQATEPTWTSAASVSNEWSYLSLIDLSGPTTVAGDTGFVVATADSIKKYEINVNRIRWVNVIITARTEGELTAKLLAFPRG